MSTFLVENHHNHHYLQSTIYTTMSKRKLLRRELPYISTLLDKLPYSRLPTNEIVLKRLMFEVEHLPGTSLSSAAITVRDELVKVWEYARHSFLLSERERRTPHIQLHQLPPLSREREEPAQMRLKGDA